MSKIRHGFGIRRSKRDNDLVAVQTVTIEKSLSQERKEKLTRFSFPIKFLTTQLETAIDIYQSTPTVEIEATSDPSPTVTEVLEPTLATVETPIPSNEMIAQAYEMKFELQKKIDIEKAKSFFEVLKEQYKSWVKSEIEKNNAEREILELKLATLNDDLTLDEAKTVAAVDGKSEGKESKIVSISKGKIEEFKKSSQKLQESVEKISSADFDEYTMAVIDGVDAVLITPDETEDQQRKFRRIKSMMNEARMADNMPRHQKTIL